ncbi:hypothetical protein Tco_0404514 [Tanacetum coccineum]
MHPYALNRNGPNMNFNVVTCKGRRVKFTLKRKGRDKVLCVYWSWYSMTRWSDCPELKNQNHRNQVGGTGARGMVHALGGGETNQDLNDMEDDINA